MSPRLLSIALPLALALAAAVPMHAHAKKAEAAGAESEFRATGEDYVNEVNEPWLEPLSELRRSMKPGRNYVFWIISPPQEPLDLRSAEHFRRFINAIRIERAILSRSKSSRRPFDLTTTRSRSCTRS